MPPWKAEPGFGDFVGARRLTEPQIATIQAWVKAGKPEGDPADLPPQPKFTDGWQLGQPDLVVKVSEPYTLKAEGRDDYRWFVLPLHLDEDQYVTAVEFRPSNRKIVHHSLFFLDTSGAARKLDEQDPGPGYSHFGGPWVCSKRRLGRLGAGLYSPFASRGRRQARQEGFGPGSPGAFSSDRQGGNRAVHRRSVFCQNSAPKAADRHDCAVHARLTSPRATRTIKSRAASPSRPTCSSRESSPTHICCVRASRSWRRCPTEAKSR